MLEHKTLSSPLYTLQNTYPKITQVDSCVFNLWTRNFLPEQSGKAHCSMGAPPVSGRSPTPLQRDVIQTRPSPLPVPHSNTRPHILLSPRLLASPPLHPLRAATQTLELETAAGGGATPNSPIFPTDSPANLASPLPPPPGSAIPCSFFSRFFCCFFQERAASEDSRRLVRGIDSLPRLFAILVGFLGFVFDLTVACFQG